MWKLTEKKADQLCYELWDFCYQTGKGKSDWPEWEGCGTSAAIYKNKRIGLSCFYCEHYYYCSECPLYEEQGIDCGHPKSYYYKWKTAKTQKVRKKYAKKIRDIAGKRLGK